MAQLALDIDSLRAGATPSRREMALTVFAMSLPAILAELSTTLMQYIDAAMVGSLGAHATASIGIVESTIWLLDGLAACVAAGFTVQVAQLVGAGRDEDARNVFRIEAFAEALFGASMVAAGALRGAGDTLVPSVISLVSMWGVRIVLMAFMAPRWGLTGVWLAMAIELCVRGLLFLVRMLSNRWLKHVVWE